MKTKLVITIMLALAGIVIFTSSCKKLKYYEFNDDDKLWIGVYSKGETVQFVSDSGDIRTFSVSSSTRGYRQDGKNYYSVCEATLRSTDSLENRYPGGFNAMRDADGFTFTLLWPHHPIRTEIASQSASAMTLGGVTYSDIFVSDITSAALDSVTNVQTVYYSKSAGFVQYKEFNGQTWTRKN